MYHSNKEHSNILWAGAAKTDITPPLGSVINGDFVSHYATCIHDSLFAKAVILKNDATEIAIVVVDICVMPKDFIDEIKKAITEKEGIPYQNILISSTHTHAAASVAAVYLASADMMYMKKLPALIVQAVTDARKKIKPARVGFGSINVPEHVRSRRYYMASGYKPLNPVHQTIDEIKTNPFGAEQFIVSGASKPDPQVSYLAVLSADGQWISCIANYSLHYVGDWDNGTISADYYGVFAEQIKNKLKADDEFVGIMSNGTSGDINIWDFQNSKLYPTENFKKSELIGNDIAEKVFQSLHTIQWEESTQLSIAYEEVPVAIRKPSGNDLAKAGQIIARSNFENIVLDEEGLQSIYAREQVLLNELPRQLPFPVQALKIGSIAIGALGAEIFAETGLWLKENSPVKKYFTIGLANGNLGYLPPAREIKKGGYETWRSRTSKLEENAEEKIKNKLLELIGNI